MPLSSMKKPLPLPTLSSAPTSGSRSDPAAMICTVPRWAVSMPSIAPPAAAAVVEVGLAGARAGGGAGWGGGGRRARRWTRVVGRRRRGRRRPGGPGGGLARRGRLGLLGVAAARGGGEAEPGEHDRRGEYPAAGTNWGRGVIHSGAPW